jgi:hypothetical protein
MDKLSMGSWKQNRRWRGSRGPMYCPDNYLEMLGVKKENLRMAGTG